MQSWGRWLGRVAVVASLLLLALVAWRYEQYATVFGETACKRDADLCDDAANSLAQRQLGRWMLGGAVLLVLGLGLVANRRVGAPRVDGAATGSDPTTTGLLRHAAVAWGRGTVAAVVVLGVLPFWLFGGTALYVTLLLSWVVLLAWLLDRSHRARAPEDGDLGALLVSGAAAVVGVGASVLAAAVVPRVVAAPAATSWFALVPVVLVVVTGAGASVTVLAARLLARSTARTAAPVPAGHPAPVGVRAAPLAVAGVVAVVVTLLVTTTPAGRDLARSVRDDLYPAVPASSAGRAGLSGPGDNGAGGAGRPGASPAAPDTSAPAAPPTPAPAPVVADRVCTAADLTLAPEGWDSAMGSSAVTVVATNRSATPCWLGGLPDVRLEQGGADLALHVTRATRTPGSAARVPAAGVGLAARGGHASFGLWWRGYRSAADQHTPQSLVVTPSGTGPVRLGLSAPYLLDVVEGAEVEVLPWAGPPATSG